MKYRILPVALAALFLAATPKAVSAPPLINYQGRVLVGTTNFDGPGKFKFALVNGDGTTTYWSNDQSSANGSEPGSFVSLQVVKGLYSVLLGDNSLGATMRTIGAPDLDHPDVRLRVWFNDNINGFQLLSPDQRLAPAAYLADGVVSSATIADSAITAAKIADASITSTKVGLGAISNGQIALNTLDATRFAVPGAPVAGQVLGYSGTGLTWTAPGGGVFSLNGTNAYYNGGNVGIGTATPTAKLDVRGAITLEAGSSPVIYTGTGNTELNRYLNLINSATSASASGLKAGGVLVSNDYNFANPGKNELIVQSKVAIGTATFADASTRLTIRTIPGLSTSKWGMEHTDGTVRLATRVDDAGAGFVMRSAHPLNLFGFNFEGLTINTAGEVGIGTTTPQAGYRLHVVGATQLAGGGSRGAVQFGSPGGETGMTISGSARADLRFNGSTLKLVAGPAGGPPAATNGIAITTAGDVGIGTTSPQSKLDVNGTIRTKVLTILGADVAEPFEIAEQDLPKGTVVVIDETRHGGLKRSTASYDTRVAGIVSGANGIDSGIILSQPGVNEGGQNVAISGRVYVQGDASSGAIKPGDLLTTSDIPGHAMKVTDHAKAQGAVIGKAMSSLEEGTGMVLVLVALQ